MDQDALTAGDILLRTRAVLRSYERDTLPVVVAVADPKKVNIGISIQRDYPLTMIERGYGIPFGRLRSDSNRMISDPKELHACKWSIEVHEAVFRVDATNDTFIQGGNSKGNFLVMLSTGLGNVLQNRQAIAWENGHLHAVVGEQPADSPYPCLVYSSSGVSIELLRFNENGGFQRLGKNAGRTSDDKDFMGTVKWAISGYPLVLDGIARDPETTAATISDYRHAWRLPKLQKSLVEQLSALATTEEDREKLEKSLEFYFAFDLLGGRQYLPRLCRGESIEVSLDYPLTERWENTIGRLGQISPQTLRETFKARQISPKIDDVVADFSSAGYRRKQTHESLEVGDFFIDESSRKIIVRLMPAIYPHHIVGTTKTGALVNISIAGKSGRSGITLEGAKQLAMDISLTDALIFDNGFDVFSRIGGGAVVCHGANVRQTRTTAALHFGCFLGEAQSTRGAYEGFELAFRNETVVPEEGGPVRHADSAPDRG